MTMTKAVDFRKIKRAAMMMKVARVLMAVAEYDAESVLQKHREVELRMKPVAEAMAL